MINAKQLAPIITLPTVPADRWSSRKRQSPRLLVFVPISVSQVLYGMKSVRYLIVP